MEYLIKYRGLEANPLYNCSYDKTIHTRREVIGSLSMILGTITSILFIICLKIMLNADLIKLSCYKIMFFVGVTDVLGIFMCSILTGWLAFFGVVFCDYPLLIYISGSSALCFWCSSCMGNIILLINRILCFKSAKYHEMLFEGKRTYITLTLPIIYGLFFFIYTKPVIFSSALFAWLFDPFIFPDKSAEYTNHFHTFNNFSVFLLTLLLYLYIAVLVVQKWRAPSEELHNQSKSSYAILKQAVAICAIDQVGSAVYVAMNFITFPAWTGVFAELLWFLAHSFPVIVYLTMNRTMKSRFLKMFCKSNQSSKIHHSSADTTAKA